MLFLSVSVLFLISHFVKSSNLCSDEFYGLNVHLSYSVIKRMLLLLLYTWLWMWIRPCGCRVDTTLLIFRGL